LAFGGVVSWDGKPNGFPETDGKITHHIIDRSLIPNAIKGRDYVQPQVSYTLLFKISETHTMLIK